MAAIERLNVTKALTVTTGDGKVLTLPRQAQEIIKDEAHFEEMLKELVRTGGRGKLQRDGKIYYDFYAKADMQRVITSTLDDATGLTTVGMYGAQVDNVQEANSTFGYVAPTTIKIAEDFVELKNGLFFKELITKREQESENMPTLVAQRIATYRDSLEELRLAAIKAALVDTLGTVGAAATNFGFTPTAARVLAKDYTVDEAGGLLAYEDIRSALVARKKIGRNDGTGIEVDYPFRRGNTNKNSTIVLSENLNTALTIAFKESPSGSFPGLQVSADGNVQGIFGATVMVMDMPQKGGKDFNWMIVEKGQSGAIAMPSVFEDKFQVRPHYEGVSHLADIVEGSGGSWNIKPLQPELNFGSFGA